MKTRTKLINMAAVILIAGVMRACGTSSSDISSGAFARLAPPGPRCTVISSASLS